MGWESRLANPTDLAIRLPRVNHLPCHDDQLLPPSYHFLGNPLVDIRFHRRDLRPPFRLRTYLCSSLRARLRLLWGTPSRLLSNGKMCHSHPRGPRRSSHSITPSTGINQPAFHPGVGRNAALSFSELGYTVFALCPNRQDESGPPLTSARSRDVASVRSVFSWQRLISPTKTPLVRSFFTSGTTGRRGRDRFPGA